MHIHGWRRTLRMLWLFTVKLVWQGLDWWFVAFSCSLRLDFIVGPIESLGVCVKENFLILVLICHCFLDYHYDFIFPSLFSSSQQPMRPLITTTRKDALMGRLWFSQVRLSVNCILECCYLLKCWSSLHLSDSLLLLCFS